MNRYMPIIFSAIFLVMTFLPCQVLPASITETNAAIGKDCTASGDYSTAMGRRTTASGTCATAMGNRTTASGTCATAMGNETTASGPDSTAMGTRSTASGPDSTAMGHTTTANGFCSTASGAGSKANGDYSWAGGKNMELTDDAEGTFVWGHYNAPKGGVGISISTAHAFLIFPDGISGNVGIGTMNPSYKLHVNGTAAGTSWTNLSSRDYKEDIRKVDEAVHPTMLAKLMDMNLTTYKYKEEYGGEGDTKLGFIAEDMPDEVLSKDGKGVDIYELVTLMTGAIKAQQKEISEQRRENNALKAKLEDVIARLEALEK